MKNLFVILILVVILCNSGCKKDSSNPIASSAYETDSTVTYFGKSYHKVKIGTQIWMKENLEVGTMKNGSSEKTNNCIIEKYCYNDDPANCITYGGLYQWNEAMQYVTTERTKGICPTGWHIPTIAEYQTLDTAISFNGNSLKAVGQGTGTGAGTNISGFSTLLAGYGDPSGFFFYLGSDTYSWISTEYDEVGASGTYLNGNDSSFDFYHFDQGNGFSVRCVKD